MNKNEKYFIWQKGEKEKINEYFSTSEFSCQCKNDDCKEQKISIEFINSLTDLRKALGQPLTITSGFRCKKHQEALRSSGVNTVVAKTSTHELGEAADVKAKNTEIEDFLIEAAKHFKSIGIAHTFLHLDNRRDKVRRWNY